MQLAYLLRAWSVGGAIGGGDEASVLHQRRLVLEGVRHLDFDAVGVASSAERRLQDQLARGRRRRHASGVAVLRGRHEDAHHVLGRGLAANGAVAAAAQHAARRPRRAARTEAAVLVVREAAVRRRRRVPSPVRH
jgi:hypothetical protein